MISLKFRQIKIRKKDNNFLILKNRFYSRDDLLKYIKKKGLGKYIADIYVSVALFLNPTTIRGKKVRGIRKGYVWADNCFLKGDFVLEIDSFDKNNILKAYMELRKLGFEKFFYVKTSRGLHIWVLDFWEKWCEKEMNGKMKPREKEEKYGELKIKLAKYLENKGIDFDFQTTIDTRRVVRMPDTYHKNGYFCKSYSSINEVMRIANDECPVVCVGAEKTRVATVSSCLNTPHEAKIC